MSFTFDMAQINVENGSSPSNVRYLLTDTDAATAVFSDEEIAAVLEGRPTYEQPIPQIYRTASQLAATKARYYSRIPSVTDDKFVLDLASVRRGWEDIAASCATLAQYAETGDVIETLQGGRLPVWSADGMIIGGDGWLI